MSFDGTNYFKVSQEFLKVNKIVLWFSEANVYKQIYIGCSPQT